jgi:signal transduction histidine kinase
VATQQQFNAEVARDEGAVLALAPTGKDAALLESALDNACIPCQIISSLAGLTREQLDSAGALLIAEEALTPAVVEELRELLADQPSWSDIPLLVLVGGGRETVESRQRERERMPLPHATLLERPIRVGTLLANVRFAQRAREKQFQMKKSLEQRRLAEDALRKSEKLAVAGRLAASIAHEINNPLESVTNLLYLIRHSSTLDDAQKYCGLAENELRRVSEIATQTLRFYRQQAEATRLDVTEIATSVLTLYQGRLHSHDVQVVCDFRTHASLLCYAGELRQLVANLVSNALDAMGKGGVLTLRLRNATCLAGRRGIRVTVADTGSGIPQTLRKQIFEPFVTTKGETGTGLGLWVSAEILRKHDGHLSYRSSTREGRSGTAFSIFLPFREAMPLPATGEDGSSVTVAA